VADVDAIARAPSQRIALKKRPDVAAKGQTFTENACEKSVF